MPTESPPHTPNEQAKALGRALRALRERTGVTQEQAAEAIQVKRQAWSMYESGERNSLLRVDLQDRVAGALGLSRADLVREVDRQSGALPPPVDPNDTARIYQLPVLGRVKPSPDGPILSGVEEPESYFDFGWLFGANARTLRVVGDRMAGYVESGQLVVYDVSRWPTRGEGCVVELNNGDLHPAECLEVGQGVLKVRVRSPEEALSFPMSEVKGVYLIRFRGE